MVKVKICGITNPGDAYIACEAGADALGFVFFKDSPRYITPEEAKGIVLSLPPFITVVGLFVNEESEKVRDIVDYVGLDIVQLHGEESPEYCKYLGRRVIKAFRISCDNRLNEVTLEGLMNGLSSYKVSAYLLDTYHESIRGGTGRVFDWKIALRAKSYGRIILAGGLNPDNILDAVRKVEPYGVDVSSGVEIRPGKKDSRRIRAFIRNARGYDGERST